MANINDKIQPPAGYGYNTYVGARYVPVFDGDWDINKKYEPLMIVIYQGNSYTSRTFVPAGIQITNEVYWALTGNYNAQVEAYREEVQRLSEQVAIKVDFYPATASVPTSLTPGSIIRTAGYYSAGDGGGCDFYVSNSRVTPLDIQVGSVFLNALIFSDFSPKIFGAKTEPDYDNYTLFSSLLDYFNYLNVDANYTISNSLTLGSGTMIKGSGTLTITKDAPIITGDKSEYNCLIEGIFLRKPGGANYHIDIHGALHTINDVSTFLTSTSGGTLGGISITNGNYNENYVNRVTNCRVQVGKFNCTSTDSWVENNIFWRSSTSLTDVDDYAVTITGSSIMFKDNQIVGGSKGGVFIQPMAGANMIDIINNFFDGSYDTINTGYGLVIQNAQNLVNVSQNRFYNCYLGAINLITSNNVVIANNGFINSNRSLTSGQYEINLGKLASGNNYLGVFSNQFCNYTPNNPIQLFNAAATSIMNVSNNRILGTGYNSFKNFGRDLTKYCVATNNLNNNMLMVYGVAGIIQELAAGQYGIMLPEYFQLGIIVVNRALIGGEEQTPNTWLTSFYQGHAFVYQSSNTNVGKKALFDLTYAPT